MLLRHTDLFSLVRSGKTICGATEGKCSLASEVAALSLNLLKNRFPPYHRIIAMEILSTTAQFLTVGYLDSLNIQIRVNNKCK